MANPNSLARSLLLLASFIPAAFGQSRSDIAIVQLSSRSHVANEVIVHYRAGAVATQRTAAIGRLSCVRDSNVVNSAWRKDRGGDIDLVRLPAGLAVATAIRALQTDPAIEYVEPNWILQHSAVSNDAYFTNGSLWGMYGGSTVPANTYGSGAAAAWAKNQIGSDTVYVGIIDEGVHITHSDLAANIWKNPKEMPNNGIDDDGNGLVDDVNGWDFAGNNNTVYDGTVDDHGTHVAGTIGAVGGNRSGVAGVCWNVKMIPVKFLGATGGTTANAVKAIDYLTDLKLRHGIRLVATNNSWGGGGFSQALSDAIARANLADILFVAAAGNNAANNDLVANYPSNYNHPNVIAVAAITSTGALATFSNYGATTVHIGAPGAAIWSSIPGRNNASSYASYNGTSMATPHVTGACALYASVYPTATGAAIKSALLSKGVVTPSLQGRTTTGKRLDVSQF